jgi:hypothetical protein
MRSPISFTCAEDRTPTEPAQVCEQRDEGGGRHQDSFEGGDQDDTSPRKRPS